MDIWCLEYPDSGHHMRYIASITGILAITAGQAIAGPDVVGNYLMDEPASLMDVGIMKLNALVRPTAFANYNWDENSIEITSMNSLVKGSPSDDALEKLCADWISSVRVLANIDPLKGAPFYGAESNFARLFLHSGYQREKQPENMTSEIDRMIQLTCILGSTIVTAPLLGTGYSLRK